VGFSQQIGLMDMYLLVYFASGDAMIWLNLLCFLRKW